MPLHSSSISSLVMEMGQKLMAQISVNTKRKDFFALLANLLRPYILFDRLCINLYNHEGGMLTYFTAVEGAVVSTLSPVRPAEEASTVAGRVIATRNPVIITDLTEYFANSTPHPIAEAGLSATMAFPLILDNEIIATLHCSFARAPERQYEITSLLTSLSPTVATCIGAILSLEQYRNNSPFPFLPLAQHYGDTIICHSPRMKEVMRTLNAVAKFNIPILIHGETGTGKSLIAHYIHRNSTRKEERFIKVNCPSIPHTLFESELFGHAKGSFTGAVNKRVGRFELAHGGTLFLDEIGDLTPEMQSKLLQVLEDSSFERVGESVSLSVDVRIIAATNIHLGNALANKSFRSDLLFRLSLCTIELPPLRERSEDILPLATALSAQIAQNLGVSNTTFRAYYMTPLLRYSWPGNVRELRNVVTKLLVAHHMGHTLNTVLVEKILQESNQMISPSKASIAFPEAAVPSPETRKPHETLEDRERKHIIETLQRTHGVIAGPKGAASILGIPRTTLQHKMQKLGISKKDFQNL